MLLRDIKIEICHVHMHLIFVNITYASEIRNNLLDTSDFHVGTVTSVTPCLRDAMTNCRTP